MTTVVGDYYVDTFEWVTVYRREGDPEDGTHPVDYIDKALTEKKPIKTTRRFNILYGGSLWFNLSRVGPGVYREVCNVSVVKKTRALKEKILDGLFAKNAFSAWVLRNKDYCKQLDCYSIAQVVKDREVGEVDSETSKKFSHRNYVFLVDNPLILDCSGSIRWNALLNSFKYSLYSATMTLGQLAYGVLNLVPFASTDSSRRTYEQLSRDRQEAAKVSRLFLYAFYSPSKALSHVQEAVESGNTEEYFYKKAVDVDSRSVHYFGHKY